MIELDAVDQMLERARAELSPTGADKVRARDALGTLGAVNGSGARARPRAAGFWQRLRASGRSGVTAGVVVASLSFGAGYWLRSLEPRGDADGRARVESQSSALPPRTELGPAATREPPRAASEPPSVASVPEGLPALDETPQPRVAPPAQRQRQGHSRAPTPTPAAPAAGDELALLRRVQRALRAGDPALALALLGELDAHFPSTTLVEERQAAAVMAHCGLADPGARRRADAFLEEHPNSVYAERVLTACGAERPESGKAGEGSAVPGHE